MENILSCFDEINNFYKNNFHCDSKCGEFSINPKKEVIYFQYSTINKYCVRVPVVMNKKKAGKIQIGSKTLTYGKNVEDMNDCNELYAKGDYQALRLKLEKEGYLFLRGVISKESILKARRSILVQAAKDNSIEIDEHYGLEAAKIVRKLLSLCLTFRC